MNKLVIAEPTFGTGHIERIFVTEADVSEYILLKSTLSSYIIADVFHVPLLFIGKRNFSRQEQRSETKK